MDKHNTEIFSWSSESWKDPGSKTRARTHYNSFRKGLLSVSVGDFILVSNADSLKPESTEFCFVGKALDLYEKDDLKSPYCCKVQWYSRIHDLPPEFQHQIMDPDYVQELVLDYRNVWNSEVDAETIFKKCDVIVLADDIPASEITPDFIDEKPLFYCRYAFDGKRLFPAIQKKLNGLLEQCSTLITTEENHYSQKNKKILKLSPKIPSRDKLSNSIKVRKLKEARGSVSKKRNMPNKENSELSVRDISSSNDRLDVQMSTPTKSPVQPTPVKSFYSSEKKKVWFGETNASQVRRALPFNLSKPDIQNHQATSNKTCLSKSENRRTKRAEPQVKSRESSPTHKKPSRNLSSTVTKNETSPLMKTCVTRSGRKVSWPNYLHYWESDSLSTKVSKLNKAQKPISEAVSTGEESGSGDDPYIKNRASNNKIPKSNASWSSDSDSEFEIEEPKEKIGRNAVKKSSVKRKNDKGISSSSDESSSGSDECDSSEDNRRKSPKVKRQIRKPTASSVKKIQRTPTSLVRPRKAKLEAPKTPLEEARANLHVSAVPDSLPCRDEEFSDIFTFVEGKLLEKRGGCMYISGVPGTGKTATVHEVIRSLEESRDLGHLPPFKYVEINALRLTNPHQCYVHFLKALKGVDATAEHALDLLSSYFEESKHKQMTILMLDELDMLWTKRQDVLYNIFQWPTHPHSHLVVLAIANTMDLPERLLANRVTSRLGLTRMTFQPYTFKQLQEIIMSRLQGLNAFNPDAVQLVSRKVASVSGDARRALDICRRATELVDPTSTVTGQKNANYLIGMKQVDTAIQEMFRSSKISAIRNLSFHEQLFLRAIVADFLSSGVEETVFHAAAKQHISLCHLEGVPVLNQSKLLAICSQLFDTRLLLLENGKADIYQRIKLNVSIDDINYALKDN